MDEFKSHVYMAWNIPQEVSHKDWCLQALALDPFGLVPTLNFDFSARILVFVYMYVCIYVLHIGIRYAYTYTHI